MAKNNGIKWYSKDIQYLRENLPKYNAKIYYARNKHPELIHGIADTLSQKEIASKIKTRKEFNELKKNIEFVRHTKAPFRRVQGAKGAVSTPYEIEQIKHAVNVINSARRMERARVKKMDVISQGKKTGLKRKDLPSQRLNELRDKKFDFNKKTQKELESFKRVTLQQTDEAEMQKKKELYKENYIRGLIKNGYAQEIIDTVQALDAQTVIDTYYSDQDADIDYLYVENKSKTETDASDYESRQVIVSNVWDNAKKRYQRQLKKKNKTVKKK